MFTGLIETCGKVLGNKAGEVAHRLEIEGSFEGLRPGDSIAVNGVCLTLLADSSSSMLFDVSPETLARTTLGSLIEGDVVNLERAMQASGRFGGHYVSGHVDGTAKLQSRREVGDYIEMVIDGFAECDILYLLPKGSITLNGVSLTINTVNKNSITVMLVPHTLLHTTLGQQKVGNTLNVEFDYLARMIAHQVKREFLRLGYDKSI